MPIGAWRRRHPLPTSPGMIRVQPIGECTPAEAEAYRAGRDAAAAELALPAHYPAPGAGSDRGGGPAS
jgi:hypothetical protein